MRESWDYERDPLSALRGGDPRLFEAFVLSETRTFYSFFLRLGAHPSEAEDLVQDLFLKLFRHADSYQPQERFAAFAFRVARNAWIDRTRRHGHFAGAGSLPDGEFDREPDHRPEPLESLARREEGERLTVAVQSLPETHRMVFELGVVQELPYVEIAALLGIPVGTVKSRMFHAVRKLREALSAAEAEDRATESLPDEGRRTGERKLSRGGA